MSAEIHTFAATFKNSTERPTQELPAEAARQRTRSAHLSHSLLTSVEPRNMEGTDLFGSIVPVPKSFAPVVVSVQLAWHAAFGKLYPPDAHLDFTLTEMSKRRPMLHKWNHVFDRSTESNIWFTSANNATPPVFRFDEKILSDLLEVRVGIVGTAVPATVLLVSAQTLAGHPAATLQERHAFLHLPVQADLYLQVMVMVETLLLSTKS